MKDIYSPYKILHYLDRVKNLPDGSCWPIFSQIDLTNTCNYNCFYCSSQMYPEYCKNRNASVDTDDLKRFLTEGKEKGLEAIEITGGGEPTLYDEFPSMIDFIKKNFDFALVTNGSHLYRDEIKGCLKGAKWVRLSIDAATQGTFDKVHQIGSIKLQLILDSAEEYHQYSTETTIGFSFVVNHKNYHEIVLAAKLAKEYGFSNIRYSPYYHYRNNPMLFELEDEIQKHLDLAKKEEGAFFRIFTFEDRISQIYKRERPKRCYYGLLVSVIAADGNAYTCCARKNETKDKIGNIEESYESIYGHRNIIFTDNCPPCWMDEKNRIADYMMLENPAHVNFI